MSDYAESPFGPLSAVSWPAAGEYMWTCPSTLISNDLEWTTPSDCATAVPFGGGTPVGWQTVIQGTRESSTDAVFADALKQFTGDSSGEILDLSGSPTLLCESEGLDGYDAGRIYYPALGEFGASGGSVVIYLDNSNLLAPPGYKLIRIVMAARQTGTDSPWTGDESVTAE